MKLLETIKTLKVKPCEHCHKVPELICGWADDDSPLPDLIESVDEDGWGIQKEINPNVERVFAIGLKHESCGDHYPFSIVNHFLLPRAFNIFPEDPCSTIDAITAQFKEWDDEWTLLYSKIVEEWNNKFGEGHPPIETLEDLGEEE